MKVNSTVFKEGKEAYFSGSVKNDNPYDIGSENYVTWLKGYKTGEREDTDHDPDGN